MYKSRRLPYALIDHFIPQHAIKLGILRLMLLLLPRPPATRSLAAFQTLILIRVNPPLAVLANLNLSPRTHAPAALDVVGFHLAAPGEDVLLGLHLGVAVARVLEEGHAEEQLDDEQDEKGNEEDDHHGQGGDEVVRGPGVPGAGVEGRAVGVAVGGAAEGVADQGIEAVDGCHDGGGGGRG